MSWPEAFAQVGVAFAVAVVVVCLAALMYGNRKP
jgi:hypothetical protein